MARPIRIVGHGVKPADQFQAHPNNPRKHPQRQRTAVAESISRLGWYDVVIENVRTGNLIDGHERIWQALEAGDDVPFIQVDLSEEEERLALASHDWLSSLAEYDRGMLDDLLHQIDDGGKLLEEMAADFRIEDLLPAKTEDPGPQIDRAEELREKWGTAREQVWQVGEHRVMCGDSTSADDVAALMGGVKAGAVVTDIPYEISQTSNGLRRLDYGIWDKNGATDIALDAIALCSDIPTITAFCGDEQLSDILRLWGDRTTRTVAWVKANPTVLNGQHIFLPALELAAHGRRNGAWFGGHCVRSVWEGSAPAKRDHPTQKPVELMRWLCELTAAPESIVYDPFLGSGTTLVACQQTGRRGYGMEIDPAYVAVTLERLAGMGLEPRLVD